MNLRRSCEKIAVLCTLALSWQPVMAQSDAGTQNAINLYNQHSYASAADAFEVELKKATPNARLYYYAAMANKECNRSARAKQLFDYLIKNFPTTGEGRYAQQAIKTLPGATASAVGADLGLPQSVLNALPKEMLSMLNTQAGKQAVRVAMQQQAGNVAIVRQAEKQGILNKKNTEEAAKAALAGVVPKKRAERPFTPEDIAKDGAGGIDQMRYPNCWFEASMSALAQLPRGQKLMSSMIRYGAKDGTYVVRFPNDGVEYMIGPDDLAESGIHDKALWASLIECAEIRKFPNNEGSSGADGDQSRLEVGLNCITGAKSEILMPGSVSVQELSSFIGGAVKSQNPIVGGTWTIRTLISLPEIIVPQHAYTIVGFDPNTNMVTIRNPHGKNSERFDLETDPKHESFEQLDDGVFKMSLPLIQKYFHSLARSFI